MDDVEVTKLDTAVYRIPTDPKSLIMSLGRQAQIASFILEPPPEEQWRDDNRDLKEGVQNRQS